jgi:hypothetical protein
MDIEDTVQALLRVMCNKIRSQEGELHDSSVIDEIHQKLMIVYYSAFTDTNDHLLDYLPPVEHTEN